MKKLTNPYNKKIIASLLIILILFYAISCKYFKYETLKGDTIVNIQNIGKIYKYFLVHSGQDVYSLSTINLDSTQISGELIPPSYLVHYQEGRSYRMNKSEYGILNEVHIYLKNSAPELGFGFRNIPLSDISEIRIIEKDGGKTTASYVFGAIGILTGVFVIITIIAILTKSSCPYVYAHDGESFLFEGEIFGGAIAQNLQREDYLPLPRLQASENTYRLRISNELKERQYTDLAELVVVEHAEDKQVLLDKSGNPHLLADVRKPTSAKSYSDTDLFSAISEKDKGVYFFNDADYSKNGVILQFDKPEDVNTGKLVLNSKNTLWFDYQFGKFLEKFGGYYDQWMDDQSKVPSEERIDRIIDSDFPLSIYINKNNQWELVDRLFTVGPLATRDLVIPVDISDVDGDQVELKLETGFMFWEIDYAGMDFSKSQEVDMTYLKPTVAYGTGSVDWTHALAEIDDQYMAQEQSGEVTEIVYRAMKPRNGYVQTCFLHTSGYYELIRDFEGLPEVAELNKFKTPGYFSDFSRANYLRTLNAENNLASTKTMN